QLGFDKNPGGLMNDAISALDTISVAVIDECKGKACFHQTKLEVGDIIFFDNDRPYNFMTNDYHSYVVLSIPIDSLEPLQPKLSQAINHTIKDTNGDFSTLVHQIWHRFANTSELKKETKEYVEAEMEIISTLQTLLETQTPKKTKLTKGEKTVLDIRDQVYAHMDGKINIASLAKQHNISERTLQKSFKSLFGFSPTLLLRNMKLNLVYRDLKFADPKTEKVSRVAQKWGFMHMGRFSSFYTELFGENPSQTLKRDYMMENTMSEECVERQEEMV
ncbi:MAG: helix-turn-helix transcriptional regulator, partial [Campylobacterota bacterium]|nr:helix-turn-helix transcriptional regulator [Campylobacterota bacterium]